MNALVIYDSQYSNTERIALTIADALGKSGQVQIVRVDSARSTELQEVDLLVVGCPTQGGSRPPPYSPFLKEPHPNGSAAWQSPSSTPASGCPARLPVPQPALWKRSSLRWASRCLSHRGASSRKAGVGLCVMESWIARPRGPERSSKSGSVSSCHAMTTARHPKGALP